MQRDDVVLYADGGDMTVGRRTAVYTYGNFQVIIPDDREQETGDDRLQDGYISRPTERPTGRFDIGFVRADTTIDLNAGTSDLESVIDAAQKRTEGDIFFERDISGRGLGRYQIGVDFDTDDVVQVEVWGKRLPLPVTSAELAVTDSAGVRAQRVHVGGQLVADAEALRKHNSDLLQQIASEKRQRLKEVGAVRKTADSADDRSQSTAEGLTGDPDGDVQSAWEDPGTPIGGVKSTADTIDFDLDQAVDLVAQGLDIEVPEGKESRVMFSIAQVLALGIQANSQAIRANQTSIMLHENRMKWMRWTAHQQFWVGRDNVDNEWVKLQIYPQVDVRASSIHITPKPGWRGKITMIARFGSGDTDIAHWDHEFIDGSGTRAEFHGGSLAWQYESAVVLISPLWGPDPREYVLVGGDDGGFIPNDDYHNYYEWNPLNWVGETGMQPNAVEFVNGITVTADRTVRVLTSFSDDYVPYGAGLPIYPGWFVAPVEDSVGAAVKFTELK